MSHGIPVVFDSDFLRDRYEHNISAAADYNLYHRLYIVERKSDYFQIAGFGAGSPSDAVFNFYLNRMPYLENFVTYFEYRAESLIESYSLSNRVIVPDYLDPKVLIEANIASLIRFA